MSISPTEFEICIMDPISLTSSPHTHNLVLIIRPLTPKIMPPTSDETRKTQNFSGQPCATAMCSGQPGLRPCYSHVQRPAGATAMLQPRVAASRGYGHATTISSGHPGLRPCYAKPLKQHVNPHINPATPLRTHRSMCGSDWHCCGHSFPWLACGMLTAVLLVMPGGKTLHQSTLRPCTISPA